MISRRQAIKTVALTAASCAASASLSPLAAQPAGTPAPGTGPSGPFLLPPLPYPFDALEPHIDARTMEIHHDKHHAAYVANLNKALADHPELARMAIDELVSNLSVVPDKIRTAVRNNGGGHYNHSLFWQMMTKGGGGAPKGELSQAIDKKFGSFAAFKDEFTKAALGQFGSGWAWLCYDAPTKQLAVRATPNQDIPSFGAYDEAMLKRYGLKRGDSTPLLGVDVWEHAYYLKYQNRRADYVAAFFNVINWDFVSERFQKAIA